MHTKKRKSDTFIVDFIVTCLNVLMSQYAQAILNQKATYFRMVIAPKTLTLVQAQRNYTVSKKRPNFETIQLEIMRIDFDDMWQKYLKVSILRCVFHFSCRFAFQPTVLTVALLLHCCVCRRRLSSVCDVMYCG